MYIVAIGVYYTQIPQTVAHKRFVGWNRNPMPASAQNIGNDFISTQKALVLKVPSATVKDEWNYLINPPHQDFKAVKIIATEPFSFDTRLFKR
jgi:RES domain-containing protein